MSPEVTAAMSEICGIPLLPHTIPHQMGHLNYNPEVVGQNVNKWHVDTLRIDYVMFVTDRKAGIPVDEAKVVSPTMPGPGYAVLQQGNMIVHRAKGLSAPGKRITMENGYVPQDIRFPDFSRYDQLVQVDPPHGASSECARHVNWMARERLNADLADFRFSDDKAGMADQFTDRAKMLTETAEQLLSTYNEVEHFGDG